MGPLAGIKVIELAGLGPAPMAGMMFADMGAEVVRIERGPRPPIERKDVSNRGKKSIILDLKRPEGAQALLRFVERADVVIDPFRPGVMERLGIGPDVCLARNRRIVFARMTGWGQTGPLAQTAGHDINYIAISGVLHAIGRPGQRPVPPLNLVGDMGGGGMLLAYGVVCALLAARISGQGQVVDAAMIDGAAQLMWMFHGFHAVGIWNAEQPGTNLLDGGAPFYDTYETLDGKYVAVGAIEPQFYAHLLNLLEIDPKKFGDQMNEAGWPATREEFARVFRTRTRDAWCGLLEGTDACFAPVLSFVEAAGHPHNVARNAYLSIDGVTQAAPAPRFSRTAAAMPGGASAAGADGVAVCEAYGFTAGEIDALRRDGVLKAAG